jgi:ATP-dependent Clp protease ATP-binding subunit ClpA
MGVSLGRVRSEIERQVAKGDGKMGPDMQLTPRAKRVIDLAYDEARQLGNNHIGTEHFLLGLIREGGTTNESRTRKIVNRLLRKASAEVSEVSIARKVLASFGVDLEKVRAIVTTDPRFSESSNVVRQRSTESAVQQRFTERARRIMFFAQEEAKHLGENYVSTEHLLLGLVKENDSIAARILDRMGVSLDHVRSEIERQVAKGDGKMGLDMQLTPRAKRVIDLAYDEACQLKNNHIGTEHLLLGLIREGETTNESRARKIVNRLLGQTSVEVGEVSVAGKVLASFGVDLEKAQAVLREIHPR